MKFDSRSSFTWLDYSEYERRRMIDVIHAFQEKGTRDELGIGKIRDGLADLLFPGTGTVQTRARYFLFVPWLYKELEEKGIPSREIVNAARTREIELISALIKGGEKSGGIIGIEAKANLQRLPSNIYWQGLGVWGIRRCHGSQGQYHRSLDRWYSLKKEQPVRDRGEDYVDGLRLNWHPAIPGPPSGWKRDITFKLTKDEARFLQEGIMNHCSNSLLSYLIKQDRQVEETNFIWNSELFRNFPSKNQYEVTQAQNFSDIMHGAALLYNLLLALKSGQKDKADQYDERLQKWARIINNRMMQLSTWDVDNFWRVLQQNGVVIPQRTFKFVDKWIHLTLKTSNPAKLPKDNDARQTIRYREIELKKGLARLENNRALELWNGAAGAEQLDFRWRNARQITNDILQGLGHA